jgi:endoglycosylceramidase
MRGREGCLLVAATLLGCAPDPCAGLESPEPGPLHAVGTELRDGSGRLATLRGAGAGGRSKFAPYRPFDLRGDSLDEARARYLDRAQDWGFSVLRVPFSWAALEPVQGQLDTAYLAELEAFVDAAWQRGMWTVLDFHQDVYAESLCGDGFPEWTLPNPGEPRHDCPAWFNGYSGDDDVRSAFDRFWAGGEVMAAYQAMWDVVVARFAEHPGVIGYEPINEPHSGTADSATWSVEVLAPFYEGMSARMQALDPDALVFVDSSGTDGVQASTALPRPAGEGIVFAPHYYAPAALFGGPVELADVEGALGRWAAVGQAWDAPVFLGEFGIRADHDDGEEFADRHYDALDALGMHASWWEYSDAEEQWNEEDLSLVGPSGQPRDHLLAGVVRPHLRLLAGDGAESSWDRETRRWQASWTAGAGVTEVRLPAWLYPDGVAVQIEGGCAVPGDTSEDGGVDRELLVSGEGALSLVVEPG